jgi:cytochrome c553
MSRRDFGWMMASGAAFAQHEAAGQNRRPKHPVICSDEHAGPYMVARGTRWFGRPIWTPWLAAMPAAREISPAAPVYHLPDFIFLRHSRHAEAAVACAKCHGDIYAQSQIRPVLAMKMAAYVDRHRATSARTTCTTCHELSQ